MRKVLTSGLPPDLEELITSLFSADSQYEVVRAAEPSASMRINGNCPVDLVVIGPQAGDPLKQIEALEGEDCGASVVVLARSAELEGIADLLKRVRNPAREVSYCSMDDAESVRTCVRSALQVARRRNALAKTGADSSLAADLPKTWLEPLDHAPMGIVQIDADHRLHYMNFMARQLLNLEDAEGPVQRMLEEFFPEREREKLKNYLSQCDSTLEILPPATLALFDEAEEGRVRCWLEVSCGPFSMATAENGGMLVYLRDITLRVNAQKALEQANRELEEKVEERTRQFIEANEALRGEIEEHEKTEAALRDERILFDTLMENIPDKIYFKDRDNRFTRVSRAHANQFDLESPAAAIGKSDYDYFSTDHAKAASEDEQEIMRSGEPVLGKVERETFAHSPDRWVSTTKMPLYNDLGEIIGTFGISRDVTERVEAEEALRYERYLLNSLMDNVPDKIYFKDRESRFLRINKAHARQFGLSSPSEALGKTDFDYFLEEDARKVFDEEQRIIATGKPIINKERIMTYSNGEQRWISATKLPLQDEKGEIIGTFGISRDITKRKEAELALEEQRNQLRTIIDLLPCRIYVKGNDKRFVVNNKASLDLLGATQEEVTGKLVTDFFSDERGLKATNDDERVINEQVHLLNREEFDNAPGQESRWVLTSKVPLRNREGEVTGLVGMTLDVTERKLIEEELREKNRQIESELAMAREIQQAILPQEMPSFPPHAAQSERRLNFYHRYQPNASLAGDFFDIIQIDDNRAGVLVCDVMGHGVRASLVTTLLKGFVEELSDVAHNPSAFLREINRSLYRTLKRTGHPMFVTAFYLVVDLENDMLVYANAGHPLPFLLHRGNGEGEGGVAEIMEGNIDDPDPALGLLDGFAYHTWRTPFAPGDRAIVYTDGLFEVRDKEENEFGVDRLKDSLLRNARGSLRDMVDATLLEVRNFSKSTEFSDDICIVAVEMDANTVARASR